MCWFIVRRVRVHSLYVISDSRERELRSVSLILGIPILRRDWTGRAIWTAQAVHADDEEARGIKGPTRTAEQGSPPVTHICTAGKGVTDHHSIVTLGVQLAAGSVRHGHIVEGHTGLKREGRYYGNLLVWDESRKGVLGLSPRSFLEVFSHYSRHRVCGHGVYSRYLCVAIMRLFLLPVGDCRLIG